jgi:hypothetical protein
MASRSLPSVPAFPECCVDARNELVNGDPTLPSGLYWKLDYQADDENVWTIDMWLLEHGARRRGLDETTRLGPLLTDDRRAVVLAIKEAAAANDRRVSGLAVCQAVVYDDVGSLEEFDRWLLRREGSRS